MARKITIDPLKVKTGDVVYVILTRPSFHNVQNQHYELKMPSLHIRECTVTEKNEVLPLANNKSPLRVRRAFSFKLHAETPFESTMHNAVISGPDIVMFSKYEDAQAWLRQELDGMAVEFAFHDERQKVTYAPIFVKKDIV